MSGKAKQTRYNELLGVPNHIRDPDLYQLLGLDRARFDGEAVEGAYKERMASLQAIKSPKHKSFIEFLKGELRRAKTTLVHPGRRAEYDAELYEERRHQLARILDVVLADGVLRQVEEERVRDLALEVGLLEAETALLIDEELQARGARRARTPTFSDRLLDDAPVRDEDAEPDEPDAEPDGMLGDEPARDAPRDEPAPPPPPAGRAGKLGASDDTISAIIKRRLGTPKRKRPATPTPKPAARKPGGKKKAGKQAPPVVAEYVGPPTKPTSGWEQAARPAKLTGWGKASLVREVGVCSACLKPVQDVELKRKKAERLPDGRLHCTGCTTRLVAGLICASCYKRITRKEMKAGQLVVAAGRVRHQRCAR